MMSLQMTDIRFLQMLTILQPCFKRAKHKFKGHRPDNIYSNENG